MIEGCENERQRSVKDNAVAMFARDICNKKSVFKQWCKDCFQSFPFSILVA